MARFMDGFKYKNIFLFFYGLRQQINKRGMNQSIETNEK